MKTEVTACSLIPYYRTTDSLCYGIPVVCHINLYLVLVFVCLATVLSFATAKQCNQKSHLLCYNTVTCLCYHSTTAMLDLVTLVLACSDINYSMY